MKNKTKNALASGQSTYDTEREFAVNLMEHLVVPTFVIDAECRVMIWNHACERLTGLSAAPPLPGRSAGPIARRRGRGLLP